jgi:hypothetical protein
MGKDKKRRKGLSSKNRQRIKEEEIARAEARLEFEEERKLEILNAKFRADQEPFSNAIIALERILDYETIDSLEAEYIDFYDLVTNKDVLVGFFRETERACRSYFVKRSLLRSDPDFDAWEKGENAEFPKKYQVLDDLITDEIDKIMDKGSNLIDIIKNDYKLLERLSKSKGSIDYKLARSYCAAFTWASKSIAKVVADEFRRSSSPTFDTAPYWKKFKQFYEEWTSYFRKYSPDLLVQVGIDDKEPSKEGIDVMYR